MEGGVVVGGDEAGKKLERGGHFSANTMTDYFGACIFLGGCVIK